MGYSPDKMLQGRIFAYHDAHLHRIGTNHQQLAVNRPRCPVMHHQRDGAMASDAHAGQANFGSVQNAAEHSGFGHRDAGWPLSGHAGRHDPRATGDPYTQAGNLFRLLPQADREALASNIGSSLALAPPDVQRRQLEHFSRADTEYGNVVRRRLETEAASARGSTAA
jgi:catalase